MSLTRHKAIAIPVCYIGKEPHFLIVRDKRFKEWTFVTGGCRKREIYNPLQCALRELEEETRGVVNIQSGAYSYFMFTSNDPATPGTVDIYHVYVIDFPMSLMDQEKIITRFKIKKDLMDNNHIRFKKQYDENDFIDFDTFSSMKSRKDLWKIIHVYVVDSEHFENALKSKRTLFSMPKSK